MICDLFTMSAYAMVRRLVEMAGVSTALAISVRTRQQCRDVEHCKSRCRWCGQKTRSSSVGSPAGSAGGNLQNGKRAEAGRGTAHGSCHDIHYAAGQRSPRRAIVAMHGEGTRICAHGQLCRKLQRMVTVTGDANVTPLGPNCTALNAISPAAATGDAIESIVNAVPLAATLAGMSSVVLPTVICPPVAPTNPPARTVTAATADLPSDVAVMFASRATAPITPLVAFTAAMAVLDDVKVMATGERATRGIACSGHERACLSRHQRGRVSGQHDGRPPEWGWW